MPENYTLATRPIKAYIQGSDGTIREIEAGAIHFDTINPDKDVTLRPEARVKLRITATLRRWKRKDTIRLKKVLGLLRSPRCTYCTNMATINRRRYNGHKRPAK